MKFVLKLAFGGLLAHVAGFVLLFLLAFSFSRSEILSIVAESLFILGITSMFLALFLWFGIYLAGMNPKPGELLVIGSGFVLGFSTITKERSVPKINEPSRTPRTKGPGQWRYALSTCPMVLYPESRD